ncbi:MAG TPA: transglutaminase family protein [Tepidisphaeraceae bacterium]|nr:transglutaminase family protein [Tepidisphaeraceae bacterium]
MTEIAEQSTAVGFAANGSFSMPLKFPSPVTSPITDAARPLALRTGYDMHFEVLGTQPTAMLLMLFVQPEVAAHLDRPERLIVEPAGVEVQSFFDAFGNRCGRIVAPPGPLRLTYDAVYTGTYAPEPQPSVDARQYPAGDLPHEVLPFLLGSRYCEVDRLSAIAWDLFGKISHGGERVLAINQWVFKNIAFGYKLTRPNKTALDTYVERTGVCRDMMHLAITFCRALNIPGRYASGYLGDIAADPDPTPMDFSAFYEVYLDGRWWPMDARHGKARVGRVPMARGRDATDVALITSFGRHRLTKFTVATDEIISPPSKLTPAPLPFRLSA